MKISYHKVVPAKRNLMAAVWALHVFRPFLLLPCFLLLAVVSEAQCDDDLVKSESAGNLAVTSEILKSELAKIRDDLNLVAVGGTVLVDGKVIAEAVVGSRKQGSDVLVTVNDKWHHGSITKSMTATMLAVLVSDGKVQWHSPLFEILPSLKATSHPDWQAATLHHLLSHSSGLPADFSLEVAVQWPKIRSTTRALRKAAIIDVLRSPPLSQPGEKFTYSNVGYSMVGMIAEELSDKPWEDLIEENVFAPLQLKTAGFGAPVAGPELKQPWGHVRRFFLRLPQDPAARADNTPVMGPAGIVHMSMSDLAKYGWAHLLPELEPVSSLVSVTESKLALSADEIRKLHTASTNDYCYGWIRQKFPDVKADVIWHNGSNTFWYSQVMLIPSRRAVVVLVTNDGVLEEAGVKFQDLTLRLMADE